MKPKQTQTTDIAKQTALKFVVLIGIISFFADMTYEGARSITGPYLAQLNSDATVVGFVAGFGELAGYVLRFVSGYWLEKTKSYWTIAFIGYGVNLIAVPLLAFTHHWEMAAVLIIMERVGKAIRIPARDTMLSHATHRMGVGWGFGLHEMFDKMGAMLGPLIIAAILFFHHSYQFAFGALFIPALIAIFVLIAAAALYPHPQNLELKIPELEAKGISKTFWLYLIGAGLIAAGFADFPLIAYHFEKADAVPTVWIPVSYAFAMAVSGVASLAAGSLYDRFGFKILIIATLPAMLFAPLVFLGNFYWALAGMFCWGLGMGTQSSLMKAIVANMVASGKRASAYGVFNMGYGILWFLGSVALGRLYDFSVVSVVIFSLVMQLAALPFFLLVARKFK